MRMRIYKELRLLFVPAGAMLVAATLSAWLLSTRRLFGGQEAIAREIAQIAFILGIPLIAATPIGAEFHYRTLALLLAQPVARWRLWLEKWLIGLSVIVIVLAGFHYVIGPERFPGPSVKMVAATYVGILACSAPLWSLVARSTIGGLVLCGAALMFLELAMADVHYRLTGGRLHEEVFAVPAFNVVRASYALLTLLAGWWLFTRYQATDAQAREGASGQGTAVAVLRPRPRGAIANLVRKELMLQRTTFMVAAGFAVCWVLAMLNAGIQGPSPFSDVLFPFLLGVFVPIAIVLAGTMSNNEDRALGTHPWHLTLPIEAKVQWEVKFAVSLVVGLLLAVGLPAFLVWLAAPPVPGGDGFRSLATWRPIGIVAFALVLCFWASSLFGHTVGAIVGVGASVLASVIGIRLFVIPIGDFLASHASLRTLSIRPASFAALFNALVTAFLASIAAAALFQSYSAFRRVQSSRPAVMRAVLGLLVVSWVAFLIVAVLESAVGRG